MKKNKMFYIFWHFDKTKAISDIINLDYTDDHAVFRLFNQSKIFKEDLSYENELKLFQDQCPTIESIIPLKENNSIRSDTKKLGIVFTCLLLTIIDQNIVEKMLLTSRI